MTAIVVTDGDGPRLHAFVVGVGHYPNVGRGLGDGEARRLLDDLTPLTAPVPSAVAVAEWLLRTPRSKQDPPVGTVEVLISAVGEQSVSVRCASGATVAVERAVFAHVRDAFTRWFALCRTGPDNIALFYFCGHGWDIGEQLLLLEDVGSDPWRLLANCIDLSQMRAVMRRCAARTQLYLVDACRELPTDLLTLDSVAGSLMDVSRAFRREEHIDAPVLFSTAQGNAAYGDRDCVTPYTAAVLQALDGLGARRDDTGWTVTTESLAGNLRRVIAWNQRPGGGEQGLTVDGLGGSGVLRSLDGPPIVPFRVTWGPSTAPPPAGLRAQALEAFEDAEPPAQVFEGAAGEITAGLYRLDPDYPEGSGYRARAMYKHMDTPNTVVNVKAEPA